MEGVPDNLVPLILITSQAKEERTWVSTSRKLLTVKIQNNQLFVFSAWIPWRPNGEAHAEPEWCTLVALKSVRNSMTSDIIFFSKTSSASVHPQPFSKWLFGSRGTPLGWDRIELSFLLHPRRSWFISLVSQRDVLAMQTWSGCSVFLALKEYHTAENNAGFSDQRAVSRLLTSKNGDLVLTHSFRAFLSFIHCLLNINTEPVSEHPSPIFQVSARRHHPQNHCLITFQMFLL